MTPPSLTVEMRDTGDEVNTEFPFITAAPKEDIPVTRQTNKRSFKDAFGDCAHVPNKRHKNNAKAWACSACTFHNAMTDNECQVCQGTRNGDEILIFEESEEKSYAKSDDNNSQGNSQSQGIGQGQSKDIVVCTYNVWFNEEVAIMERIQSIGRLVQHADVVLLQEVTPLILDVICNDQWYVNGPWKHTTDEQQASLPYFNVILTRHEIVSSLRLMPFSNSKMGRYMVSCDIKVRGNVVTFATSHLESPVGPYSGGQKDLFTPQRKEQLKLCLERLSQSQKDVIFAGDMNWIDPTKNKENDGFMALPKDWTDAWLSLKGKEPGYTYDCAKNAMLTGWYKNRLDRVLFRAKHLKLKDIELIGTLPIDKKLTYRKLVGKNGNKVAKDLPVLPSDHFGLCAVFDVGVL